MFVKIEKNGVCKAVQPARVQYYVDKGWVESAKKAITGKKTTKGLKNDDGKNIDLEQVSRNIPEDNT